MRRNSSFRVLGVRSSLDSRWLNCRRAVTSSVGWESVLGIGRVNLRLHQSTDRSITSTPDSPPYHLRLKLQLGGPWNIQPFRCFLLFYITNQSYCLFHPLKYLRVYLWLNRYLYLLRCHKIRLKIFLGRWQRHWKKNNSEDKKLLFEFYWVLQPWQEVSRCVLRVIFGPWVRTTNTYSFDLLSHPILISNTRYRAGHKQLVFVLLFSLF